VTIQTCSQSSQPAKQNARHGTRLDSVIERDDSQLAERLPHALLTILRAGERTDFLDKIRHPRALPVLPHGEGVDDSLKQHRGIGAGARSRGLARPLVGGAVENQHGERRASF
jgi:hypothetical protein